jgi:hypothetical protein
MKTKSSQKVHIDGSEIYSLGNDKAEQKESESFLKVAEEYVKSEFLKNKPEVKTTYFVEFYGNTTKTGKIKDFSDWVMRKYTQDELDFANQLIKDNIRIDNKYAQEEKEMLEKSAPDFDKSAPEE